MTNAEKFKSSEERERSFIVFCDSHGHDCKECPIFNKCIDTYGHNAAFAWLELEAEEEKPLPCIYCKGDMVYWRNANGSYFKCAYCNHQTRGFENYETAVKEYNRVAKIIKENEGE